MAFAQSEPQYTVDVSVGGGVATNPFLYSDGDTAASATVSVSPSVFIEDELGQTRIGGDLRLTQYINYYGSDLSGRLAASTTRRLAADRQSVGYGKSMSVRVDLGGRRILKKTNINSEQYVIK